MKEFLIAIDSLVKRGLSSSLTFFSLLFVAEWIISNIYRGNTNSLIDYWGGWVKVNLLSGHATLASAFVLIFLVIGLSYTLAALNEIVYDNTLRENFDPLVKRLPHNRTVAENLTALRGDVVIKLKDEVPNVDLEEKTDFFLYEIVGGIVKTDTRGYVDVAKAVGTVFVSVILVGLVELVNYWTQIGLFPKVVMAPAILAVYFLGREAVCTQYRSRAIRLYINYLMMPPERVAEVLRGVSAGVGGSSPAANEISSEAAAGESS